MMKNLLKWRLAGLLFALLSVLSACKGGTDPDTQKICADRSDCAEGERCGLDGFCTTESQTCTKQNECGAGEYCNLDSGTCESSACQDDSTCGKGTICSNELCRPGCRSNDDCDASYVCQNNVCQESACDVNDPNSCGAYQVCRQVSQDEAPKCVFSGECNCDDSNPESKRPNESAADFCQRVSTGNSLCQRYAVDAGLPSGKVYICSSQTQRCIERPNCSQDLDCGGSERICVDVGTGDSAQKLCRPGCRSNDDCSRNGESCLPNPNPTFNWNTCQRGCTTSAECETNEACLNSVCITTCEKNSDCKEPEHPVGTVCRGDYTTNNIQVCGGCANNGDCATGEFCDLRAIEEPADSNQPDKGLCKPIVTCPEDNYGDNDTTDTAYEIVALPFVGKGNTAPFFCKEKEISGGDWYTFDAPANTVITAKVVYTNNRSKANLDLQLFKAGTNLIAASARPPAIDNGIEELRYGITDAGTYTLNVTGAVVEDYIDYEIEITAEGPESCEPPDALEPNNTRENAVKIDAKKKYLNLQVCGNDKDFYKVCPKAQHIVNVSVIYQPRFGEIEFTVTKESDSTVVAKSATNIERPTELFASFTTEAEECFIVETVVKTNVGKIDYEMEWEEAKNNCSDNFEPNDKCTDVLKSTSLTTGTYQNVNLCRDSDWYCFDILPLEKVEFSVCSSTPQGSFNASLYTPNCGTVLQRGIASYPTGKTCQTIETEELQEAGKYCVNVYLFQGAYVPYTIDFKKIDAPKCDDDNYNNNTPETAKEFNRAQAALGKDNIAPNGRICDITPDWYKIALQAGDKVEFNVRFKHSEGNLQAYLYGPGSTTLLASGESDNDNELVSTTATTAGDYYLKVTADPAARSDYNIVLKLNGKTNPDPDCPDKYEDNDTLSAAVALDSEHGPHELTVCRTASRSDDDWFKYDLVAGDTVSFTTTFGASRVNVALYSADGNIMSGVRPEYSNTTAGGKYVITYTALYTQTVYLKISPTSVGTTPYGLEITKANESCEDDRFDTSTANNNDAADATPFQVASKTLTNLTICENNVDWYEVTIPRRDQSWALYTRYNKSNTELKTTVYEENGTTVVTGTAADTTLSDKQLIPANTTAAVTYKIKVEGVDGARAHYALIVDLAEPPSSIVPLFEQCPDVAEVNNTKNTAYPLPLGTTENLLICARGPYFNSVDQSDWFTVDVPAGATLTVDIKFEHDKGDIDAAIYEANNNTPVGTSNSTDDNEQLVVTPTSTTTYYIRVYAKIRATFDAYYDIEASVSYSTPCDDSSNPTMIAADMASATTTVDSLDATVRLCENTQHWYKLGANITSINAIVDYFVGTADVDIALYKGPSPGTGILVTKSETTDNHDKIEEPSLDSSSEYYLNVYSKNNGRTEYKLWLATSGNTPTNPYCGDKFEVNDTSVYASNVSIDPQGRAFQSTEPILCQVEEDWYKFTLSRPTSLLIAAFGVSANLTLELKKDDPSGTLTDEGTGVVKASGIELEKNNLAAGTYYVKVSGGLAGSAIPYNLFIGETVLFTNSSVCRADSFESAQSSNNPSQTPSAVNSGETYYASICAGDVDYYKVNVPAGKTLNVTFYTKSSVVFDSISPGLGFTFTPSVEGKGTVSFTNTQNVAADIPFGIQGKATNSVFVYYMKVEVN